jgi:hypothetical protein
MTTTDHPGSAGEQSPPLDDLAARLDEALARTDDLDPLPRQLVRDVLDSSLRTENACCSSWSTTRACTWCWPCTAS